MKRVRWGLISLASDGSATSPWMQNAATWQVIPSPTLGNDAGAFNAVAVVPGTNQLWAVGYRFTRTPPYPMQTLIERWDGTAWQVVANPVLPEQLLRDSVDGGDGALGYGCLGNRPIGRR